MNFQNVGIFDFAKLSCLRIAWKGPKILGKEPPPPTEHYSTAFHLTQEQEEIDFQASIKL